ncbi:MAG: glycine betaine ABC transporter substrate-binding protein [Clostridiales bacterium]|nr:glycine betaine ABC transporter substrate-binding protein [Clostridiales bacterium]
MKSITMKKMALVLSVILVLSAALIGCGSSEKDVIKVGSKDYTEQLILGQITILALEEAGFEVEDKTNVAGSDKVRSALIGGDLDVYWEYTGTAWLMHLQNDEAITDSAEAYRLVKEADDANGLVWLNYAPFNNTYTIMMRRADSEALGVASISDLAAYMNENPGEFIFGVDHEFTARPDGLPALEEVYGFKVEGDSLAVMDAGILYKSLLEEQVDTGMGFSTDGRIAAYDFVNLVDDKDFFPVYNPAAVLRKETIEANPEIVDILNEIASKLDNDTMIEMNYLVDIEEMEPKAVAEDWLREQGIIE